MKKIIIFFMAVSTRALVPALLESPTNVVGGQREKSFLVQKELVNVIAWQAPSDSSGIMSYGLYRDIELNHLVATVPATAPLIYQDNNRTPGISYTYYLVSQDDVGDVSLPVIVAIEPCARCVAGISVAIG